MKRQLLKNHRCFKLQYLVHWSINVAKDSITDAINRTEVYICFKIKINLILNARLYVCF